MKEAVAFSPREIAGALAFIHSIPETDTRIYVEVFDPAEGRWTFVYGDRRSHVPHLLELVVGDRPFRVRGADIIQLIVEDTARMVRLI